MNKFIPTIIFGLSRIKGNIFYCGECNSEFDINWLGMCLCDTKRIGMEIPKDVQLKYDILNDKHQVSEINLDAIQLSATGNIGPNENYFKAKGCDLTLDAEQKRAKRFGLPIKKMSKKPNCWEKNNV